MSTSTKATNVAKTTPIGIYAVAQHMLDRQLPAPYSIDAPQACLGERAILVAVPSTALDAWLDSIVVDAETTTPASVNGYVHAKYDGRLDNGVRVQIAASRRAPVELKVVQP